MIRAATLYSKHWRLARPTYDRDKKRERKAAGVCYDCPEPAPGGRSRCPSCAAKAAANNRKYRAERAKEKA